MSDGEMAAPPPVETTSPSRETGGLTGPRRSRPGSRQPARSWRPCRIGAFALMLLAIEFFDEFVFGVREAAWPLVRDDLNLSYAQIGLVLAAPGWVSSVVEPFLGILGDVWRRRVLILTGGAIYALALVLTALSQDFALLLIAFILMYPASGAFVSLSQATLMDSDPSRHEQNMARWTLAGSIGVVVGPLFLTAITSARMGWRAAYLSFAGLGAVLTLAGSRALTRARVEPDATGVGSDTPIGSALKDGWLTALRALRRREVLRWLALLHLGDMTGDILLGYLALYFVDVVAVTPVQAGLAVAVWTGIGLLGNLLVLPPLERVSGLRVVRWGAVAQLMLLPAFLLAPDFAAKLVLMALLGLFSLGWYPVLQAQVYSAMPGHSGTVMAVGNIAALVGGLIPLALGLVAERFDLTITMWLLVLGPLSLLVGIPRRRTAEVVA